jgi:peptide/nickel transport system permease protein
VGVIDTYLSFPYILIAIVWAALIGTTILTLVLIVGVRGWVEFARVVRAQVLSMRERDYVAAAAALGASDLRVVLRYILPGTASPVLVIAGFQLGRLIVLEATLSFLGLGIQPPTPAWGAMLADARLYMAQAWWTVAFPSLAISLVVLSANFLGDGLRDRLDPTLRGRL